MVRVQFVGRIDDLICEMTSRTFIAHRFARHSLRNECSTHRCEIWFVFEQVSTSNSLFDWRRCRKIWLRFGMKKKSERKRPSNRLHQSLSNVVYVAVNNLNRIGNETVTIRPMWKILNWKLFSLCYRLLSRLMWLTLIRCKLHIDILTSKTFLWIVAKSELLHLFPLTFMLSSSTVTKA